MRIPKIYIVYGVAAVVVGYLAYRGVKAAAAIASTKLNPFSDQNFIYDDLIGGVGRSVSGDESWTLGGAVYEMTHPDATFENPDKPFCTNFMGIGCPDNSEGRDMPYMDN